ncbi:hypothetical protein B0H14DRAFT_1361012 [Mycena olivaceomarginata]|nr:hypothetical protein B0H14DRAFT_1361012 [Mycena olivaceomarginata]
MKFTSVFVLLVSVASTRAAVNGACSGGGLDTGVGVCISTSKCKAAGGVINNGLCPNDPNDIKCCTKAPCAPATSGGGICRFTNTCTGNHFSIPGQCPGGNNFKCCVPCVNRGPRGEEPDQHGSLDKRLPIC